MGKDARKVWTARGRALKRGNRKQLAQTIKRQGKLALAVARG